MTEAGPTEPVAPPGRARRLVGPIVALGVTGGVAAFLVVNGPHVPGISCPSRALTGLDCPGCGSTRAMAALLHGDLGGALDQNLLVVAALPLLLWAWTAWLSGAWRGRRIPTPLDRPGAALVTLVAVVAFTVIRNVDLGVGSFLASGPG